ncbi:MAG: YcxB family protein [Firmicutes bacterium]|nr:YcxB family protein [Bacillota bacterium]
MEEEIINESAVESSEPPLMPASIVEVRTKMDAAAIVALNKYHQRHLKWLWVVISVAFAAIGVVSLLPPIEGSEDIVFGVLLLVLAAGFPFLFWWIQRHTIRKLIKSAKAVGDDSLLAVGFTVDKVCYRAKKGNDINEGGESAYSQLFKAIETKTHFFLYISSMQAFILPKTDFVCGTSGDLRALLFAKMGINFKLNGVK